MDCTLEAMEIVLEDGSDAVMHAVSPTNFHHLLSGDADQVRVLALSVLDCAEFNNEVRVSRVFKSVCMHHKMYYGVRFTLGQVVHMER